MEKQREIAENLWAIDVDNAFVAYENAVAAFNAAVSPNERITVSAPIKPHVESLYQCQGPCYKVFETLPLAMYSHSKACYEKHGSSGSSSSYWSCEYNVCPNGNNHWKECRASACSVLFPPPEHEHTYDDYDHKVKCTESVYDFWNPSAKCGEEYYTCEHSTCPKSNTHWSTGSTPPSGGGSTPPSGGSTPPSGSTPPAPPTVICGGAAWTDCDSSGITSSTTHYVQSCSQCFSPYWSCSQWAYRHTSGEKTCRRPGCGVTFYQCQNGTCTSNWGTNAYHWAQ